MAKTIKVIDGRHLIGDVQTTDIEDLAVTAAKIPALVPYIGVYGYAEYGRSVYNFT